jgi:enterochelin esterase family protein
MIAESEPQVSEGSVTFRLPDGDAALTGVRLLPALSLPHSDLEFTFADGQWTLTMDRPPVHRMEYRVQLRHPDLEEICDPNNPLRAPGAFGDKSVVEFPDYVAPQWLDHEDHEDHGHVEDLDIDAPLLGRKVAVRLWETGPGSQPLLVAHDGPEYDRLAGLTRYAGAQIAAGTLPPFRVALLAPGDRDDEYAANPRYAATLHQRVLPTLRHTTEIRDPVVGMGASLGGLAMLHAQRVLPGLFGGLFLQSASFLTVDLDPQEQHRFSRFGQVSVYVADVLRTLPAETVPVTLTCGLAEENLANNRQMAVTLRKQGYGAKLVEVPDAHNYVGWRDAFHPALTDLLREVWTV